MDWRNCKKKYFAKEIKIDRNLISSLIASSAKKMESQKLLPLNDTTASSKISLAYDSLRELLEALSISKNYKIYNHECYCAFLNEVLEESSIASEFDKFRKLRNAINYYGKDISSAEAEEILKDMLALTEKINQIYFSDR